MPRGTIKNVPHGGLHTWSDKSTYFTPVTWKYFSFIAIILIEHIVDKKQNS